MENKYAILTVKDLKIRQFEHRDDYMTAVNTLIGNGTEFVTFKYNHGAKTWTMPETVMM